MTGRIVVLGAINMDLFVEAARFPRAGETFEGDRFYTGGGGKGANQAIAAARLAGAGVVEMVGQVGGDPFGRELLENFERAGVGRRFVKVDESRSSGIALIFIDRSKENYVLPVYGANGTCGDEQIADARGALNGASVLLVQQETPLDVSHAAMEAARDQGVTVLLDPAPVRELPDGFVEAADIVAPNQIEAQAITGISVTDAATAAEAASALRARGVPIAIVKLGEDGCYVDSDGCTGHFPAFAVTPVATVAAGDAFCGALAAGLAEGMLLQDAVRFANAAGALCVTKPGAQDSMPSREEVEELLGRRP